MGIQVPGWGVSENPTGLELHGYSEWQHPHTSGRIYMNPEAVRAISSRALQALRADPSSEVGGLLWGKFLSPSRNDGSVAIVFAQFIHSEQTHYNATDADTANLVEAIHRGKAQTELTLVGYFRSHVREDLHLSESDQDLIYSHMPEPSSAFLIIRPFEIGICMAGFFFWNEGRLQADSSDLEVPLVASPGSATQQDDSAEQEPTQFADLGPSTTVVAPSTIEHTRDVDTAGTTSPTQELRQQILRLAGPPRRIPPFLLRLVMVGSVAAALVMSCYWGILRIQSGSDGNRSKPSKRFGLEVVRAADGHLNVRWGLSAEQVRSIQKAKLTVVDEKVKRELLLDASQLRLGNLTYFPVGSDIQFRLQFQLENGQSESESVNSILPDKAAKIMSKGINSLAARQNASMVPSEGKAGSFAPAAQPVIQRESRMAFSDPVAKDRPAVQKLSPVTTSASRSLKSSVHAATVSANTVSRKIIPSNPPVVAPAQLTYVPPVPIKQMKPDLTLLKPGVLEHMVKVKVQIRIDAEGRVISAHSADQERDEPTLLSKLAISTAREWRFNPATLQGKPIAADHTIVFVFRPSVN